MEALEPSEAGSVTSTAAMPKSSNPNITGSNTSLGDVYVAADPTRRQLLGRFIKHITPSFESGAIRTMAIEKVGGLDQIKPALERMVAGNYSAVRLVASW